MVMWMEYLISSKLSSSETNKCHGERKWPLSLGSCNIYKNLSEKTPNGKKRVWWLTSDGRPIFWWHTFCLAKKNRTVDMQCFSRIGKTMSKWLRIPYTMVNTSIISIFWNSLIDTYFQYLHMDYETISNSGFL